MITNQFSVVTSVYKNDKTAFVKKALDSMLSRQSIQPTEIILVQDGPIPKDLSDLISTYEREYPTIIRIIRLDKNGGLGKALRIGVDNATYDLIARMDSDDICLEDRFEKQLNFFNENPECDIVGGQMTEFIGIESNIVGKRPVPCNDEEIKRYLRSRCPLNHVTVMFKKKAVLGVGNYQEWHYNEDYYLWIRMTLGGCCFANLPDTLVNVRVGKEMYARRGGWKYFKSEKGLQNYMLRHKMISLPRYCYNVLGRFVIQVAMPNKLRGFIFQKLFRQH